jgi:transcriptional regulator with XRE-family HTH domain
MLLCQFDPMSKLNYINIGNNIKRLRIATGLSQHELSTLIPISKRSIAKIEAGNPNLSVTKVNILVDFFNLPGSVELSSNNLLIDNNLRKKLAGHHKISHPEYIRLLTKTPSIVYAIDFELLPSNFLMKPRQIHEIKAYFARFGWDFLSSSLTNALLRKPEQISSSKLVGAKDVNLYSQKNK